MRPKTLAALVVAAATALVTRAESPAGSVYEWCAVAPLVVVGTSLGDNGRYHEIRIEQVLRGALLGGQTARVELQRANRDRDRSLERYALLLEEGRTYLFLLEPAPLAKAAKLPTFRLVRGLRGVRELPSEGREALLGALGRCIGIQDLRDDRLVWHELGLVLEESNPLLIVAALDQFLKFHRGEPAHLASLRPLLDHPSPELRERSARVIGQIVAQHRTTELPDGGALRNELVAHARRDDNVDVRIAATAALQGLDGEAVARILGEIADADPDQRVRYAAEKAIYDRLQHGRGADGD